MTTIIETLILEALAYEAMAFEADEPVNGADMVEWFADWRRRAKATIPASSPAQPSLSDDEPHRFRIYYRHCGREWQDTWSCACNDRCPVCDREIEPYDYEEIVVGD